ncbi:MAG: aldolase/citrate lyase family protein, partial [Pseudomonadales bacterium]
EYLAKANGRVQLWIQIESVQALDAFDAIAQTPGLAGVFFGPADITASLGRLGAADDPEMEQRVLDAIGKAQALGVPSGLMTGSERFLGEARKAGATLLGVGADTALLAATLRRHAKGLKGALK